MIVILDYVIRLCLVAGAILICINASCPNGETPKAWARKLKQHAAATITPDEHRYAAVLVEKLNRKFEKFVMRAVMLIFQPFKHKSVSKIAPDGLLVLVTFVGPFFVVNIMLPTENEILLIIEYIFYISGALFICTILSTHPSFGCLNINERGEMISPSRAHGWRKIVVMIALLMANRKEQLRPVSDGPSAISITFYSLSNRRALFLSVIVGLSLTVFVTSSLLKIPHLAPWAFFGLYIPFGLYFSLLCSGMILFALILPTFFTRPNIDFSNKSMRLLLITTLSMYISTILIFVVRYENFFEIPPDSFRIIVTNVLCDLYVYWRFQKFIWLIRITRRKEANVRKLVLFDFGMLLMASCIMSLVSIYIGFLWTDQHMSLVEMSRLFVGLHPFKEGSYFGVIFWLVHTTFIPITVFCLIPVALITFRFARMVYHHVIKRISLKQNPLLFIAAILSLIGAIRGVLI